MESEIVFKEVLEVADDIEERARRTSAGRKPETTETTRGRSSASCSKVTKTVTLGPSSAVTAQDNDSGVHSSDPVFKEKCKDIFSTDIVTSQFDIPDRNNEQSTAHFLFEPRPMTSSLSEAEPFVRYKYKTLSGSSACRNRNSHDKAEQEYRVLKKRIAELQKQQYEKKEEDQISPEPKTESTTFSNYMDSLWERRHQSKYELLRTKELKLNFLADHDKTKINLTYPTY